MEPIIRFTEENIYKIFGAYDGEGENINRLKEYYFKTDTYEKVVSDLPIRILVGNKGIGKSALFRVALSEQKEKGDLPILIKPDDIAEIGEKHESLILSIRKWKFGLIDLIAKKVLVEFGLPDDGITSRIIKVGGKIMSLLSESLVNLKDSVNLLPAQKALIESFLEKRKIIVYLDDLDRGWQNRKEGLIMISALINCIRDLAVENPGLQFKLALRLDVFNAVRLADESSDKFEGAVVWHSYTHQEIFVMLIKRILTFLGEPVNEANLLKSAERHIAYNLNSVFESKFYGRGRWSEKPMYIVLLSLIRNRPRDIVKLCTMAAREAFKEKSNKISADHILPILPNFSKSIMNDTIAEYKSELPEIERLLYGMRPSRKEKKTSDNSFSFTTPELHAKLTNILQQGAFLFASGTRADAAELTKLLYKINFISAKKKMPDGTTVWRSYEQDSHLSSSKINFGYDWEVLLAYRWVLQSDTVNEIFDKISLE